MEPECANAGSSSDTSAAGLPTGRLSPSQYIGWAERLGWIVADAILLAVLLFIVAAILFRAKWLQWVTTLVLLIVEAVFIGFSEVSS